MMVFETSWRYSVTYVA